MYMGVVLIMNCKMTLMPLSDTPTYRISIRRMDIRRLDMRPFRHKAPLYDNRTESDIALSGELSWEVHEYVESLPCAVRTLCGLCAANNPEVVSRSGSNTELYTT